MSALVRAEPGQRHLEEAVREWLRDWPLQPERGVALDLAVDEPFSIPEDARPPFRQPGIAMRSGPPGNVTRVVWEGALPAYADLPPDSFTAFVHLSAAAAADLERCFREFLTVVTAMLLRRIGWHHVHAATAIDPRGRGWLFAGNSGAGKSTTAALLATYGWHVGTDDIAFIAPAGDQVEVLARRGPIALREGGYGLLRRAGGLSLPARGKTGFTPEELGGKWTPRITPQLVAFTALGGDVTSVEPIAPRDVLAELIRWSFTGAVEPEAADEYLAILARLGRQARSFRLRLGRDIFTDPDLLMRLVP